MKRILLVLVLACLYAVVGLKTADYVCWAVQLPSVEARALFIGIALILWMALGATLILWPILFSRNLENRRKEIHEIHPSDLEG